jgi:hypothetical protein
MVKGTSLVMAVSEINRKAREITVINITSAAVLNVTAGLRSYPLSNLFKFSFQHFTAVFTPTSELLVYIVVLF